MENVWKQLQKLKLYHQWQIYESKYENWSCITSAKCTKADTKAEVVSPVENIWKQIWKLKLYHQCKIYESKYENWSCITNAKCKKADTKSWSCITGGKCMQADTKAEVVSLMLNAQKQI